MLSMFLLVLLLFLWFVGRRAGVGGVAWGGGGDRADGPDSVFGALRLLEGIGAQRNEKATSLVDAG